MDYNQYDPHAYTECQISRMNTDLAGPGNKFIYSCDDCMPAIAFFVAPATYRNCTPLPGGGLVINAEASFNESFWLVEICEVNPADPDQCISVSNSTGWQAGEVGGVNLLNVISFEDGKFYRIKLKVLATECGPVNEYTQMIEIRPCGTTVPPDEDVFDFSAVNPMEDVLNVYYHAHVDGILQMRLINLFTGSVTEMLAETSINHGAYQLQHNVANLSAGTWSLQAIFNNQLFTKTLVKP